MALSNAVVRHLERQVGLVTRRQLVAADMRPKTADALVATGVLLRVERGVYRLRGAPVPVEQPHLAAVLRASGRLTAEPLLGLLGVRGCDPACAPAVVVAPGRVVTGVGFRVIARPLGPPSQVRRIPCVRPEDAVLDLAGDPATDDRRVRTVVDAAQWKGVTDLGRLRRRSAELDGHLGAQRFIRMDEERTFEVESEGERELVAFLGPYASFFRWRVTDVVPGRRLDGFDDDARLDLEYDGEEDHTALADRAADEARDAEVRGHDIEVIRLGRDDIRGARAPVTLARILSRRADRLARHVRAA